MIFRQGELANEAYLIRLGHIRVGVQRYGNELRVLTKDREQSLAKLVCSAFPRATR